MPCKAKAGPDPDLTSPSSKISFRGGSENRKIKVGYYITVRSRDRLRCLARAARRSCSAQLEALIDEEIARRSDEPEPWTEPA